MKTHKSLEEISLQFKEQVEIPSIKPSKQFLFCPAGFIGSGKTTISKKIADKFNLVRISSDELRLILKENGHDFTAIKAIITEIVKEFLEKGFSVALDMNCGNPITKEKIALLSNKFNVPTVWVHISPPEDFILANIRARNNIKIFSSVDDVIKNYLSQKERFGEDMEKADYSFILDPSKKDFPIQMDRLYSYLKSNFI